MKDFFDKPFTLDRIARIVFTILLLVLIGYIIRQLASILIPFALAWLVAYMLMPPVLFIQHRLKFKSRVLSIITVLVLLVALAGGIVLLLLPSVKEEVAKGWELLNFYASGETLLNMMPERLREVIANYSDLSTILAELNMEKILGAAQKFLTTSWGFVMDTVSFLMSFVVVFLFFLYLFFIMFDYEKLNRGIYKLAPEKYHSFISEALRNIEYYVNSYFKGQATIAFIVGVLFAIGFKIIGLPMGISIGLFIGVLNLIPYMQAIGIIPIILASLLKAADADQNFFVVLALALAVLGIVQVIQDTILVPKIMGRNMGMKPAVILLSLSVWGSLFGILGMLFALPITMILYTYYMKYIVGAPIERTQDAAEPAQELSEE